MQYPFFLIQNMLTGNQKTFDVSTLLFWNRSPPNVQWMINLNPVIILSLGQLECDIAYDCRYQEMWERQLTMAVIKHHQFDSSPANMFYVNTGEALNAPNTQSQQEKESQSYFPPIAFSYSSRDSNSHQIPPKMIFEISISAH